jgi:ribosomal protein S18 acetylase RimI-like enzyme
MNIFDKSAIHIVIPALPALALRSASQCDLEYLRKWKNEQKQFFFHQEEIKPEQQLNWYRSFIKRPYDLMLMVEYEHRLFGCMGIRWQDNHWDIYNVILGVHEFGRRGLMGRAFATMLDFAGSLKTAPITLQVLKHNPAVEWYQKHGFEITEKYESFFSMIFQPQQTRKIYL